MKKAKLFEYAILWHPTEKQMEDDNKKTEVLQHPEVVLAEDEAVAQMLAIKKIPDTYLDQLTQIEVLIRPFGAARG